MEFLTPAFEQHAIAGLLVGLLVGLVGVGGGSLMTPLLVLMFKVNPQTAVGTDLLYAAATKIAGSLVHNQRSTVDWPIVRRLAMGSVPAAFVTLAALDHYGKVGKSAEHGILIALAVMLAGGLTVVWRQDRARGWRSLGDTADDPIIIQSRKRPFESIARGEEYYGEGMLVWIEADQIIRAGTHGGRSLDDFARDFFGMRDGDWGEVTYDRGDVIAALNAVYPSDWTNFFATRIDLPDQPVPLGGIERGGYTLAWRDTPNPYDRAVMEHDHTLDLTHSLGISLDRDGRVLSCRWDSPAFTAGIMAGSRILAVNGVNYDPELTRAAITAALQNTAVPAGSNTAPISFVVQRDDTVSTIAVPYHAGLRWPWLIRKAQDGAHAGRDATCAPRRGVAR